MPVTAVTGNALLLMNLGSTAPPAGAAQERQQPAKRRWGEFYGRPGWAAYGDIPASIPDAGENLAGIMIRELTQDTDDSDRSLLSAIGKGDTAAPQFS